MSVAEKYYAQVQYNGVDISQDITRHLLELKYTDQVHGQSDEIEISLEDSDAKWRNEWYPKKGDLLNVSIGPTKDTAFDCGVFWIDEIESSGPPDVIIIRGLATGGKSPLNTKNSSAHEGKSLKDIATTIAKNNGLTIDDGGWYKLTDVKYDLKDEAATMRFIEKFLFDSNSMTDALVFERLVIVLKKLHEVELSLTTKKALKYISSVTGLKNSVLTLSSAITVGAPFNETGNGIDSVEFKPKRNTVLYKDSTLAGAIAIQFTNASGFNTEATSKSGAFDGIIIDRCTQNHESDLGFLKRLCDEYGIVFNIRGTVMFFTTVFKLEELPSNFTIDRAQLKSYSFKDKIQQVFKKAKVRYHNPVDKETVEGEYDNPEKENPDGETYKDDTSDDTLVIHTKSENKQQAAVKAQAALHTANSRAKDGSVTLDGNPSTVLILAGNNFDLTGCGIFSGKVHVITSSHTLSPSNGYEISADVKTIAPVEKEKHKTQQILKTHREHIKPHPAPGFTDGIGMGQSGFAY